MTDASTVATLAEAHRQAQRQASAALVARDAAIRAAMAAGASATVLSREAGVHRVQIYRVRDTGPDLGRAIRYETRDQAIAEVIPVAIGAGEGMGAYDVEAIAGAVLGGQELGYACLVTHDELRAVVAAAKK